MKHLYSYTLQNNGNILNIVNMSEMYHYKKIIRMILHYIQNITEDDSFLTVNG